MNYKNIVIEKDDGAVTLTINLMNALNEATLLELESILNELDIEETKVIIITGAGQKAFVAGADIAAMHQMNVEQAKNFSQLGHRVLSLIENYPRPVIAAINGYALGGGCELCLACDIRIAADTAKFGLPEINVGIMCGWGATQRLTQLIGKGKSKEMIYSGDVIDAVVAERIGLVNRVVPQSDLLAEVKKFTKKLDGKPAVALSLIKKAINKTTEIHQDERMRFEIECFARCFATEDQKEGMEAFLSKRKPFFKGI